MMCEPLNLEKSVEENTKSGNDINIIGRFETNNIERDTIDGTILLINLCGGKDSSMMRHAFKRSCLNKT